MDSATTTYFAPELVYTLLGTILGFALFVIWDAFKDRKIEQKEKRQLLMLLATEATENLSRLVEIQGMLKEELAALISHGTMLIISPIGFATDGWTIAKSRNLIKAVGDKLQTWISLYTMLGYVNNTLSNRDMYRCTSSGMTGYGSSVREFDDAILNALDEAKRRIEIALNTLPAEVKSRRSQLPQNETKSLAI